MEVYYYKKNDIILEGRLQPIKIKFENQYKKRKQY